MQFNRRTIAIVILGSTLLIWAPRQLALQAARHELALAKQDQASAREQLVSATAALHNAETALRERESVRNAVVASVAKAEKELIQVAPEALWSEPPSIWPAWKPDVPYVWIHKDALPEMEVKFFTEDAALSPEAGAILAIHEQTRNTLNQKLQRLMTNYRQTEVSKVEPLDVLPPWMSKGPNTIGIRVPALPEEGLNVKQAFESTLVDDLGDQRASMILESAAPWFESQFSHFGAEPKTIAVQRESDGTFNVVVQSGGSFMSVGGVRDLEQHVPAHLLPFFEKLRRDGADEKESADVR